ncbi:MAG: hypothetical protein FWF84_07915, partial [Kiritimatiellaeota bacterium]|nr:hypothetical protein [Kiritimatiellota bacterium]
RAAARAYRAEALPDAPAIPENPCDFIAAFGGRASSPAAAHGDTANGDVRPPGVMCRTFDSPTAIDFAEGDVAFKGKRGAIVIDEAKGETSFLLMDADYAQHGALKVWGDTDGGPVLLTYRHDRIVGRSEGAARIIHATAPAGLDRLPMFVVDGQTYAPGTSGDRLILPLLPGEHVFSVEALQQPPIFRDWQRTNDE